MVKRNPYPRYRYVILSVFMLVNIAIEIQWLSHASVARPAEVFYAGQFNPNSFFNIDFLAMIYMLAFLLMSFPASYIIDTYGIKKGLSIGAIMLGIFALLKAILAKSFIGVVIAQTGLAMAQPFIVNAVTAVSVRWFPLAERGTAAGFSALAQYIGIVVAMIVTPLLVGSDPNAPGYGSGFEKMLWIYCLISIFSALTLILFIKEKPATIDFQREKISFAQGLRALLRKRDMLLTILLFMIGLGIFNSISSMTDAIAEHYGIDDSNGLIGGMMLIGGILGALILPILSDKFRKRKMFLVICMLGMACGVMGMVFQTRVIIDIQLAYKVTLIASFILGFFVMSAGPIGFQYAAEISHPTPESTSQGILLWIGQLSGIIFVGGMSINGNQYLEIFLLVFALLSVLSIAMVSLLRESKMI